MALPVLNFPEVNLRFQKNVKGTLQVFDFIRKKFVDASPEEYVRQALLNYLVTHKNYSPSTLSVEKQLLLNGTKKRYDAVVYDSTLKPLLLIECKAPNIRLSQSAINQTMRYNLILNVPYLLITNGLEHVCIHHSNNQFNQLNDIPFFQDLGNL